jgi:hypothetical protein
MLRVRIRLAMSDDCRALAEMRYRFRAETEWVTETKSRFVRRCTSWMRKHSCVGSCPWRCWVLDDGKRLLGHVCVQLFEKIPNPVKDEPELHAYVTKLLCRPGNAGPRIRQKIVEQSAIMVPLSRHRRGDSVGESRKQITLSPVRLRCAFGYFRAARWRFSTALPSTVQERKRPALLRAFDKEAMNPALLEALVGSVPASVLF